MYTPRIFFILSIALLLFSAPSVLTQTTRDLERGKEKTEGQETQEFSEILPDNSFLVEQAEPVEPHHVVSTAGCTYTRGHTRDLSCGFEQEIAIGSKHKFSYNLPYSFLDLTRTKGPGDISLDYRYQLADDKSWAVIMPRISVFAPTGNKQKGLGTGLAGLELSLPVTRRLSESFMASLNAGATFLFKARGEEPFNDLNRRTLTTYNLGGSVVWVAGRHINPRLEYVESFADEINEQGLVSRSHEKIVGPGIGFAWTIGDIKILPGVAVPITFTRGRASTQFAIYISFEHTFVRRRHRVQIGSNK